VQFIKKKRLRFGDVLGRFLRQDLVAQMTNFLEYSRSLPTTGLAAAFAVCGTCLWLLMRSRAQRVVSLKGKNIVVTGCDSGFGLGTVGELANLGAVVIALVYTSEGSSKARAAGAKHTLRCDLLNEKDVAMACAEIKKLCNGDLFCVVHNAGTVAAGMIDFQSLSNYRRVMEVNFFAVVQINTFLLPLLKECSPDGSKKPSARGVFMVAGLITETRMFQKLCSTRSASA